MNYRHIYHAGNFADVFKHTAIIALLKLMHNKDAPICCIDTHAGIGLYDMEHESANKTLEYQLGFHKVLELETKNDTMRTYLNILKEYHPHYPGSPSFMQELLREGDKLIVNELHPDDCHVLKYHFRKAENVAVHNRDAYEFLPAMLPPAIKRALILIDPPFEKESEFDDILIAMEKSIKRFANGVYAIWYPIKNSDHIRFYRKLRTMISADIFAVECIRETEFMQLQGLHACGLIVINPPWKFDQHMYNLEKILQPLIIPHGKFRQMWLNRKE